MEVGLGRQARREEIYGSGLVPACLRVTYRHCAVLSYSGKDGEIGKQRMGGVLDVAMDELRPQRNFRKPRNLELGEMQSIDSQRGIRTLGKIWEKSPPWMAYTHTNRVTLQANFYDTV